VAPACSGSGGGRGSSGNRSSDSCGSCRATIEIEVDVGASRAWRFLLTDEWQRARNEHRQYRTSSRSVTTGGASSIAKENGFGISICKDVRSSLSTLFLEFADGEVAESFGIYDGGNPAASTPRGRTGRDVISEDERAATSDS